MNVVSLFTEIAFAKAFFKASEINTVDFQVLLQFMKKVSIVCEKRKYPA